MSQKQLQIQKQSLSISPQQLMVVGMLSCNVQEIEEKIKKELEENPALEKSDINDNINSSSEGESYGQTEDYYGSDYVDNAEEKVGENYDEMDDFSSYDYDAYDDYSSDAGYSDAPFSPQGNLAEETSFTESLLEQIEFQNLPKQTQALCEYIIGNLDESGYLMQEVSQMTEDLNTKLGIEISETQMYEALLIVQQLDPAGVGARDLGECLTIQLQRKDESALVDNAIMVVEDALEDFKSRQIEKIIKKTGLSKQEVKDAIALIARLNPKPANGYASGGIMKNESVIPDFFYDNDTDQLTLNNKEIPTLKVSVTVKKLHVLGKEHPISTVCSLAHWESVHFAKEDSITEEE